MYFPVDVNMSWTFDCLVTASQRIMRAVHVFATGIQNINMHQSEVEQNHVFFFFFFGRLARIGHIGKPADCCGDRVDCCPRRDFVGIKAARFSDFSGFYASNMAGRILILFDGTRGDMQPLVIAARGLIEGAAILRFFLR